LSLALLTCTLSHCFNSYQGPSLSPDGKKIAFTAERTEGGCERTSDCSSSSPEESFARIYVMNTDGSDRTQLMEDLGVSSPTWSPDGKMIAFALSGTDDKSCAIYAMNADGSGHRIALTTMEGCYSIDSLSWSPDGKKIAFEGSIAPNVVDIWVLGVAGAQGDTSRPRQVTHTSRSWWNVSPTWSPDSTEIAFTHKRTVGFEQNIHKINADGSGETRLTRDPAFHGDPADPPIDPTYFPMYSPVFSPDGTKIAFVRGYRFLENPDPDLYTDFFPLSSVIYVMDSDGSNPTVVRDFSLEQVTNLDWLSGDVDLPLVGPDQEQEERAVSGEPTPPTDGCKPVENPVGEIAFQTGEDIWTMNADGSNPRRLTHNLSREETPAFSPDGQKIAFVKEVEVKAEGGSPSETPKDLVEKVVVMDANGCNQVVLPMPKGTTHVDSMDADVPNWQGADDPTWSPDG
jgi:Tol biopolymer transport system component